MRNGTARLRGYKELSSAGAQEKGWRRGGKLENLKRLDHERAFAFLGESD